MSTVLTEKYSWTPDSATEFSSLLLTLLSPDPDSRLSASEAVYQLEVGQVVGEQQVRQTRPRLEVKVLKEDKSREVVELEQYLETVGGTQKCRVDLERISLFSVMKWPGVRLMVE